MDTLLSLAFDNISSTDLSKIRKGLRQIEGILAQICLSAPSVPSIASQSKRRNSLVPSAASSSPNTTKTLAELPSDPAFLTFFRLQDTFSHNLSSRLITTLERLLGHPTNTTTNALLLSILTLLHGILLLHPPSRSLFANISSMNLLLDLLDPRSSPSVQSATLLVLSTALLANPANARVFDTQTDGLVTVASLYKAKATDAFVRSRIEEFLVVYLMPETGCTTATTTTSQSEPNTAVRGSPRKSVAVERRVSTVTGDGDMSALGGGDSSLWEDGRKVAVTRTGVEKKRLLARYLGTFNVDEVLDEVRKASCIVDPVG